MEWIPGAAALFSLSFPLSESALDYPVRAGWIAGAGKQGDGEEDVDCANRRSRGRSSEWVAQIDGAGVGAANRWCKSTDSRRESMEAMELEQQKGAEVAGWSWAPPAAGFRCCRRPLPFLSHLSSLPYLSIGALQGQVAASREV
ncbi:unnamed protein product [Urochloa humidicola]